MNKASGATCLESGLGRNLADVLDRGVIWQHSLKRKVVQLRCLLNLCARFFYMNRDPCAR